MRKSDVQKEKPSFLSRFSTLQLFLLTASLVALLYYLIFIPVIFQTHLKNGEFILSSYRMKEDDFHHPRLVLLRKREHLDNVIKPGITQLDKVVLLRKWTRNQLKSAPQFYYPPWDAVEILDLARQHDNPGFCAQYAILFLQACQAVGLHARYVDLPGHFVTAVWVDDYNKWILMDPSNDIHYERKGVPLSGRAISFAYWDDDVKDLQSVSSSGQRSRITKKDLELYRAYSIDSEANQLAYPVSVSVNGVEQRLTRQDDYRRYPYVGRDRVGITSAFLAFENAGAHLFDKGRAKSSDPDDFHYPLNQSLIFLGRLDPASGRIKVVLQAENSPTFDKFWIQLDQDAWQSITNNEIVWELQPGKNALKVRTETFGGWLGQISEVAVFYKPHLWPRKA